MQKKLENLCANAQRYFSRRIDACQPIRWVKTKIYRLKPKEKQEKTCGNDSITDIKVLESFPNNDTVLEMHHAQLKATCISRCDPTGLRTGEEIFCRCNEAYLRTGAVHDTIGKITEGGFFNEQSTRYRFGMLGSFDYEIPIAICVYGR